MTGKHRKPVRTFDRAGGGKPQQGPAASGFVRQGGNLAQAEDRERKKRHEQQREGGEAK